MNEWNNPQLSPNKNLKFGNFDTVELAKKYSTPLMIMDEKVLRKNAKAFFETFEKLAIKGAICYASKAFSCKAIYKIIESEGLFADVVSSGELYTALSCGFNPEKIYFHGNNKTVEDIEYALKSKIRCLVVDNLEEIERVAKIAEKFGCVANVSLRLCPSIKASTHDYVITGDEDSKFGLSIQDGQAIVALHKIVSNPNLSLAGLHTHIGSQILETGAFIETTQILTSFIELLKKQHNIIIKEMNFGGGYGINYDDNDNALPRKNYVEQIYKSFVALCQEKQIELPFFVIEPGRAIVGDAGMTLYTIGSVKHLCAINKTYVAVDGSMADNPRFALYNSKYSIVVANKPVSPKTLKATIAGRCCESGDIIAKDVDIAQCSQGDILAVYSTGAYNYSMASNYNRLPKPCVLLVNGDKCAEIVSRETLEQVAQNDKIATWL